MRIPRQWVKPAANKPAALSTLSCEYCCAHVVHGTALPVSRTASCPSPVSVDQSVWNRALAALAGATNCNVVGRPKADTQICIISAPIANSGVAFCAIASAVYGQKSPAPTELVFTGLAFNAVVDSVKLFASGTVPT